MPLAVLEMSKYTLLKLREDDVDEVLAYLDISELLGTENVGCYSSTLSVLEWGKYIMQLQLKDAHGSYSAAMNQMQTALE